MRVKVFIISCLLFALGLTVSSQELPSKRPKVGLVLSGGGAKGLAHIGVIKVLEEAGVPIDYIGGTSMGAIIGGLYAMGYSVPQLDSIVRSIDWEDLLTDKVLRQNLAMIEKDEDVKYLFSFPIRDKKIALPSGIVAGQNISSYLSNLTSPVYKIKDFAKLPIPYLCLATDIERGKPVILKKGNLAEAMRASMAIPTVFTPEIIDSMALLDGGLINNFPVEEVKKMGADIIIGVDVGFRFYKQNELNSMVKIIEQSIFMHSLDHKIDNNQKCKILIKPNMLGFNMSSFGKKDSLILRGERAARQQFVALKQLADYLHSFKDTITKPSPIKPVDRIDVKDVDVVGLSDIPKDFVLSKLPFDVPSKVELPDINSFIEQLYGTRFFERITYDLEPMDDGIKLYFRVIERNTNYFRAGLHFDRESKTTLLLNTTFRNKLLRGSKISVDLALGENPSLSALFYKNTGWNPRNYFGARSKLAPDYGLRIQAHSLEVFQYSGNKRLASFTFSDVTSDVFLQANVSNNDIFNLGVQGDFSMLSGKVNSQSNLESSYYYLNFYGLYKKDSYDQAYYPSRGARITSEVKFCKGLSENVQANQWFWQVTFRSNIILPVSSRFCLNNGFTFGTLFGDSIPSHYQFFMGGMTNSGMRGVIPFVGLDFMQLTNRNAVAERLDFQWEAWKDNFLILRANAGKVSAFRKSLLNTDDIAFGYGAAWGFRSPIGPMELSLMTSNKNPKLLWFINIGYSF
ncbi:MAG: patatin-like phospholipase family protein [Bacteroidota bacterium]|nr:patatin-like phospholipase family protein [Bacteroidota bacterium]